MEAGEVDARFGNQGSKPGQKVKRAHLRLKTTPDVGKVQHCTANRTLSSATDKRLY